MKDTSKSTYKDQPSHYKYYANEPAVSKTPLFKKIEVEMPELE
jgi:hypothetical protein